MPDHQLLAFFPGLPLSSTLEFDDWAVGSLPEGIKWRSARFELLARRLLDSLGKHHLRGGAVLWHRDRGLDGTIPEREVLHNIHAALTFALLDLNDHVERDANAGHYLATTENAALFVQPIDEDEAHLTHRRGGLLRPVISGGWRVGDDPPPTPDALVPIQHPRSVSRHLSREVFNYLQRNTAEAAQIATSLEWHRSALANSDAVTWQYRFIALKTGLEILTGTDDSVESARRLRSLFHAVTLPYEKLLPWSGLLWEPRERTDVLRTWVATKGKNKGKTQHANVTEFEHWFMTLADVRNSIIHKGRLDTLNYDAPPERPLSRYAGPIFWIGERVLREAVKALLGAEVLLCGRLAEVARWEPFIERIAATFRAGSVGPDADAPTPVPLPASRSLDALLTELSTTAANTVQIRVDTDSAPTSEDGTLSLVNRTVWIAHAKGRECVITDAELLTAV